METFPYQWKQATRQQKSNQQGKVPKELFLLEIKLKHFLSVISQSVV
ncbi:MAG: hypothetical protein V7K98_12205 [Nostoc sp.]